MMYQAERETLVYRPVVAKAGGAYDKSSSPKYYLELDGAGHFAWTNLDKMYVSSIDAYGVAFFDAYLRGETEGLTRLVGNGGAERRGRFESGPLEKREIERRPEAKARIDKRGWASR
jgi:hypothetical protein